jgi:hypothetical protein
MRRRLRDGPGCAGRVRHQKGSTMATMKSAQRSYACSLMHRTDRIVVALTTSNERALVGSIGDDSARRCGRVSSTARRRRPRGDIRSTARGAYQAGRRSGGWCSSAATCPTTWKRHDAGAARFRCAFSKGAVCVAWIRSATFGKFECYAFNDCFDSRGPGGKESRQHRSARWRTVGPPSSPLTRPPRWGSAGGASAAVPGRLRI